MTSLVRFALPALVALSIVGFEIAAREVSSRGEVIQLRLAHATPTDFPYQAAAETFANYIDRNSDGTLTVDIYPNGQLGSEQVCLDSLVLGTLDLAIINQAYTSSHVKPFGFLGLAYLFESPDHVRRTVFDSDFLELLNRYITEQDPGFALLATLPCGARSLYTTRPVNQFEDLRNMKLRIMPSEIETRVWRAFGAQGISVPFGDVYSALQTDLAEGAENTPSAYAMSRHHEVAPYFTLTRHQHLTANLLVSENTLRSLSPKQKMLLRAAAIEAARAAADASEASDRRILEELEQEGRVLPREIDTAPFLEAILPLHFDIASELGARDLLTLIQSKAHATSAEAEANNDIPHHQ